MNLLGVVCMVLLAGLAFVAGVYFGGDAVYDAELDATEQGIIEIGGVVYELRKIGTGGDNSAGQKG